MYKTASVSLRVGLSVHQIPGLYRPDPGALVLPPWVDTVLVASPPAIMGAPFEGLPHLKFSKRTRQWDVEICRM